MGPVSAAAGPSSRLATAPRMSGNVECRARPRAAPQPGAPAARPRRPAPRGSSRRPRLPHDTPACRRARDGPDRMPSAVRQAFTGVERAVIALEARERAPQAARCASRVGDRLERVEGPESRAGECKRVQCESIQQAGEVKHDLGLGDGLVAGQLGRGASDGIVRRRDEDERRLSGYPAVPGLYPRSRTGTPASVNAAASPLPIRPAPTMATEPEGGHAREPSGHRAANATKGACLSACPLRLCRCDPGRAHRPNQFCAGTAARFEVARLISSRGEPAFRSRPMAVCICLSSCARRRNSAGRPKTYRAIS